MRPQSHMYADAKTWNPFKGCKFHCTYCVPSFQSQAKRQKRNCMKCYRYEPHTHPNRLTKIPGSKIVFVCGNGDIAFCEPSFVRQIIAAVASRASRRKNQVFYFQTKLPSCLKPFLGLLPKNAIAVTTLETNRDEGYGQFSKAPKPSTRFKQFVSLKCPRKWLRSNP